CTTILTDRLQPGFGKTQNNLSLGSIKLSFFMDFMRQFSCIATSGITNRSTYIDGYCVKVPHHYFKFTSVDGFPPLVNYNWWSKEESKIMDEDTLFEQWDHINTLYRKITFFINTRNEKVHCNVQLETYRLDKDNNEWC